MLRLLFFGLLTTCSSDILRWSAPGGSKRSLQVSELESVPEEADEEVQIGPAPAGNGFAGKNNTSVATEVSAGLTTDSEQSGLVPGEGT